MKKTISFSLGLIGFTATASQIVLLREFLIVFYGNEISLGFIFTSWFIAGMLGSWSLGRYADKIKAKFTFLSLIQFLLSFLLPLSILCVRSIKPVFHLDPGEIMPMLPMALASFIILAPLCILLGFMFSLGARINPAPTRMPAAGIGTVYFLEAIGSIIGGLLVTFFLVCWLNSLQIMLILGLLNIAGAFFLQAAERNRQAQPALRAVFALSFLAIVFFWISRGWDNLQEKSLRYQWKGYDVLASRNSIYGNIVATKRDSQRSFFYNGLRLYSVPDEQAAEESVHYALLEHPNPKNILLVGGGAGGSIQEILKHPVNKIDYLELDPLVIRMSRDYLAKDYSSFLDDPKVTIINLDGRLFINTARHIYDCVIVRVGEPATAQLNRYYTVEFFRQVRNILNPRGILAFGLPASESFMNRELRDFLSSVYASLKSVFLDVRVIPGDTAYFLATDSTGVLTYNYQILEERLKERNIQAKYVREYYLFSKLSSEKIRFTQDALAERKRVGLNYDFRPVSYYYNLIFWAAHFRDNLFKGLLEAVNSGRIWLIVIVFGILVAVMGFLRKQKREVVLAAVLVMGFTQMSLQIVILLTFQIIYGYIFYKLGLLISCFMIGLALGSFWMTKAMPEIKKDRAVFLRLQGAICLYPLCLAGIFSWLLSLNTATGSWIGANLIFPILPVAAGCISGAQFPLANKIYIGKREEVGRVAGLTYGLDLLGSCFGSTLAALFFIPLLGIPQTCLAIALLNLSMLIALILS